MINRLQSGKGEAKRKFHQNISDYYDQMNYLRQSKISQFEEDHFNKNAQRIAKIMHEALLLRKLLQTGPQSKNIYYFEVFYIILLKIYQVKEQIEISGKTFQVLLPY